jgi:hypothetical protein
MTYVNFRAGWSRFRGLAGPWQGGSGVLGQVKTIVYGLYGFTHGWARVLTVMSPEGAAAAAGSVDADEQVEMVAGDGRLTQYVEKREGALARLVEANGIIVLDKPAWDAKKRELGDRIW